MENRNTRRGFTQRCFTQGFTLIELLVVVLIIGILAAVAVPQYQKAVIKSRFATLKNLTESFAMAQEIYYLANSRYSNDFAELDVDIPKEIECDYSNITDEDEIAAQHKKNRCFKWGTCFINEREVACRNYDIFLQYKIWLQHSTRSIKGARWCIPNSAITDTNSYQYQICRTETGKNDPYSGANFLY